MEGSTAAFWRTHQGCPSRVTLWSLQVDRGAPRLGRIPEPKAEGSLFLAVWAVN